MTRPCLVVLVFLTLAASAFAQESPFYEDPGRFKGFKELFGVAEKEPASEEELYQQAFSHYQGRPTWLAKRFPERAEKARANKNLRPFYYRVDYERCIELFQKLVYEYPFTKHLADVDFYVAESHFKLKEYEVAIAAYQDFLVRHPRDPRAEYVYYQIGVCHWNNHRKNPLRDQADTEAAVDTFKLLVLLYSGGKYQAEAENYIRLGNTNLCDREVGVADFYFKRKQYWSAILRYRTAWSEYPGAPKAEYAQFREAVSYDRQGRAGQAVKGFQEYLAAYPEGKYVEEAKNYLGRQSPPGSLGEETPQ